MIMLLNALNFFFRYIKEEIPILTSGTNGGSANFASSLSHSKPTNQGCRLISSIPLGPHPKRFVISRSQNYNVDKNRQFR